MYQEKEKYKEDWLRETLKKESLSSFEKTRLQASLQKIINPTQETKSFFAKVVSLSQPLVWSSAVAVLLASVGLFYWNYQGDAPQPLLGNAPTALDESLAFSLQPEDTAEWHYERLAEEYQKLEFLVAEDALDNQELLVVQTTMTQHVQKIYQLDGTFNKESFKSRTKTPQGNVEVEIGDNGIVTIKKQGSTLNLRDRESSLRKHSEQKRNRGSSQEEEKESSEAGSHGEDEEGVEDDDDEEDGEDDEDRDDDDEEDDDDDDEEDDD